MEEEFLHRTQDDIDDYGMINEGTRNREVKGSRGHRRIHSTMENYPIEMDLTESEVSPEKMKELKQIEDENIKIKEKLKEVRKSLDVRSSGSVLRNEAILATPNSQLFGMGTYTNVARAYTQFKKIEKQVRN